MGRVMFSLFMIVNVAIFLGERISAFKYPRAANKIVQSSLTSRKRNMVPVELSTRQKGPLTSFALSAVNADISDAFGAAEVSDMTSSFSSPVLPAVAAAGAALLGLIKFSGYWKFQYLCASIVSGIPPGSSVIELDALDGKNIFYLPKGTAYTAVMPDKEPITTDPAKRKEKDRMNEQLVLESVGKANREGAKLSGKLRRKTQEIPSKSADCVLSTGAIGRAGEAGAVELITEAYRILRPGGLLVFVEPENQVGDIVAKVLSVFPEQITERLSAGEKAGKADEKRRRDSGDVDISDDDAASSSNDNVNKFSGGKRRAQGRGRKSANRPSETSLDDQEKTEGVEANSDTTAVLSSEENKKPLVRPGITYERVSNFFDPLVTGIAIRP